MTKVTLRRPSFRAEHIGSFLRPDRLMSAVRQAREGKLDRAQLVAVQDECIRELVALEEHLGLSSVTDGEFRRRGWSAGFIDAVEGFGLREGTLLGFRDEKGGKGGAASPYAKARLRRTRGIATDEFRFLKKAVKSGLPKVTLPSPDVMHYFLGPRSVDEAVYPDIEQYYADLIGIYRAEIAELAALGCTYLQLDDTALPCNCDMHARAEVRGRGEDPDRLTDRYVRLVNDALAACPLGMAKATHMCRGNLKGAWMAEGGYEPIAERVFGGLNVDAFFLEFDSARAGGFEPLRFVPAPKRVVLGLVSTKTPQLESADALRRRIDEAAKYVPLERLGLSPQCGFSSAPGAGQPLTPDDQKRKLELIVRVSAAVWGAR
ncbi:MAG: 5-methyltetrahydropteroyltriglutamate--homocysteine S-methyltransferase [Betaproteobacteria bacterium]|nr:5-methyltetrahydropteroyltriglutamate--homocysteine S-methyltransferase [Betaproteobacteria bacterium]